MSTGRRRGIGVSVGCRWVGVSQRVLGVGVGGGRGPQHVARGRTRLDPTRPCTRLII